MKEVKNFSDLSSLIFALSNKSGASISQYQEKYYKDTFEIKGVISFLLFLKNKYTCISITETPSGIRLIITRMTRCAGIGTYTTKQTNYTDITPKKVASILSRIIKK